MLGMTQIVRDCNDLEVSSLTHLTYQNPLGQDLIQRIKDLRQLCKDLGKKYQGSYCWLLGNHKYGNAKDAAINDGVSV